MAGEKKKDSSLTGEWAGQARLLSGEHFTEGPVATSEFWIRHPDARKW